MKCADCDSEYQETVPPQSSYISGKTLHLPFGLKVTFYKDHPEYDCVECIAERSHDRERNIYDAGFNDGVDRVLNG